MSAFIDEKVSKIQNIINILSSRQKVILADMKGKEGIEMSGFIMERQGISAALRILFWVKNTLQGKSNDADPYFDDWVYSVNTVYIFEYLANCLELTLQEETPYYSKLKDNNYRWTNHFNLYCFIVNMIIPEKKDGSVFDIFSNDMGEVESLYWRKKLYDEPVERFNKIHTI